MSQSFCWKVGLRYTGMQSGNRLLWFLSRIAISGLILAVALLIVVLSVMNGFDRELRLRILAIVPHVTLYHEVAFSSEAQPLTSDQWLQAERQLSAQPQVLKVIPFMEREALLKSGVASEPLIVYGMDHYPALEQYLDSAAIQRWSQDEHGLFVSEFLAKRLALGVGDEVIAIFPNREEQGAAMQVEVFRVAGLFDTKTELDKSLVWTHLQTLQQISDASHPQGFRLTLQDLFAARQTTRPLLQQLPAGFYAQDWSQTHGNLYEAVQMSRAMVSLLMVIIIAVAVFNVVSTLMLVVMQKKQAIAILQVMGATRRQVIGIFVIQGMMIGLVGSLIGALLGGAVSLCLPAVVEFLQQVFHFQLLSTEIYPVSYIPSDLRLGQVWLVVVVSVSFSLLASLYPAWRGAHTDPARVLRYE